MTYLFLALLILSIIVLVALSIKSESVGFEQSTPDYFTLSKAKTSNHRTKLLVSLCIRSLRKSVSAMKRRDKLFEYEKWLYDNSYKVRSILTRLKKFKVTSLPSHNGMPRIYYLLLRCANENSGKMDTWEEYVKKFNNYGYLLYNETVKLKDMAEYVLCEFLTVYYSKSYVSHLYYLLGKRDGAYGKIDMHAIKYASYLSGLLQNLDEVGEKRLKKLCEDNGMDLYDKIATYRQERDEYCVKVKNAVTSLLSTHSIFSDEKLIKSNKINALLNKSEVFYKDCDTATKLEYLRLIAKKSKRNKEVLQAVKEVEKSKKTGRDLYSVLTKKPLNSSIYVLLFVLRFVCAISVCLWVGIYFSAPAFSVLFFPVVYAFIKHVCRFFVQKPQSFTPKVLKANGKTLIVISVLVLSVKDALHAVKRAKTVKRANPDFDVCLLVDLKDGNNKTEEEDKEIIKTLVCEDKFYYCAVRERCFTGKRYEAWEKKRGAILQLFGYILGERSTFAYCDLPSKNYEYAITLDIDSDIILGSRAVRAIEHPYFSSAAVLSFSSSSSLRGKNTAYSKLFSSQGNGYSFCGFTLENDVFKRGNYTGKGICKIKDFYSRCAHVFPSKRILSHDFIEGATAGCINCDVSVTESAPLTLGQNLARDSRWIRGDWQLLPYLFPTVKDESGNKRENRIGLVNKAHIASNMFASLYPVFLLASLLFSRGLLTLFALCVPIFSIAVSLFNVIKDPTCALKNVGRQIYLLATLPYQAFVSLYSIVITLSRLVRGKKLLEWKTFRHSSAQNLSWAFCIPFALLSIVLSFVLSNVWLLVVGVIFLSGALSFILDEAEQNGKIAPQSRKTALDLINATSSYFLNSLSASPHSLIPDFYSEENGKYSNMTSPTNIGFSLVALFCMQRTGFIKKAEFYNKTDEILNSVSNLKKYRGHLYNWYDVNTGEPLSPRYVSTVDSGNFCASLCFIMDELSEKSRGVAKEFIEQIDFSFLQNTEKKLLVTGWNNDTKRADESCYDLFASESLLSYIFCIGYNKIPGEYAFSLDSSITRFCGKTLYSWTGGAFEYLMTSLFVPFIKGSITYRSALSHARAQTKFSHPFWGISESQYNTFDDSGNRKYKAFGIDKTAYKSAIGSSRTPYASALCVEFLQDEVIKNFERAQKMGMRGKYGMYEAYDGEVIRTYMAHHQGMIMLALYNLLDENSHKMAFSLSPEIESALLYLQPQNTTVVHKNRREHKLKIKDVVVAKSETVYGKNVLVSGKYALGYSDNGESEAYCFSKCVYTKSGNDIVLTVNNRSFSLLRGAKSALDEGRCKYVVDNSLFRASVTITALSDFHGEIREVEITNKTDMEQAYTLGFYLEPILAKKHEYLAHKTYSKMFIKTSKNPNGVIAKREDMAVLLTCDNEDVKEVDRGKIFRKSSSKINVDCCLFTAKNFRLKSEQNTTVHNAVICAKTELLAQNLAYVYAKSDKNTLMELSIKKTASNSVGAKVKNLIASIEESVGEFSTTPAVMMDCSKDKLYKLEKTASALIVASQFSPRFIACVTYTESDGYFKSVGNRAREEIERAISKNGRGNVEFKVLEKYADSEQINTLYKVAVSPLSEFVSYPKKPLLIKAKEENSSVNLPEIIYKTDCGGFYKDGFLIDKTPPKTWSNVVSNGNVGFIATESGDGYTFYESSRQEKVTAFSFDPLVSNCSEGVVFCEDNLIFSASSTPCGENCYCMHEAGKTTYKTGFNNLVITQKIGVGGSNKFVVINIKNTSGRLRKIYVTFFARLVLGDFEENTQNSITYSRFNDILRAKNVQNGLEVNLVTSENIVDYSFDTNCLKAKNGEIVRVKEFAKSPRKDGFVCTVCITLDKEKQVVFSLGKNSSPALDKAEDIIEEFSAQSKNMSAIKINTKNKDIDCVFPWLIPQTYFARFKARCGFYQVGGAYGFRDQLQDCLALLYSHPSEVREHILYCASRQFESGDVLHWWHHPYVGVRTRISDDRLFLPYVTAKYIAFTGDTSILYEQVSLLKDVPFDKVLYTAFTPTEYKTSLKDHLVRAIHSCKFSSNGLALMGDGDWNDAMDKAGSKGYGTSVWLSMFLYAVISECKPFLDNAEFYERILARLKESVNKTFDGRSFARLITDEGEMLGYNDGFVDIITQSWSVLSGIAEKCEGEKALQTAEKLVDNDRRIIKLLSPAFDENTKIGSIGKYPKGVRENGGQYTHGAVWYVMALYKIGQSEKAYEYLKYLLPSSHCQNGGSALYKNEPYVITADVYESGEGGWSWYTGSSAWVYVLIVEYLFGVKKVGDTVKINPALPKSISKASLTMRFDGVEFKVDIDNEGEGEWRLFHNSVRYETDVLKISPLNHNKKFVLKRV